MRGLFRGLFVRQAQDPDAAPNSATYITQTASGGLTNEQAIGALSTGYLKGAATTGVISSQATPIPIADGGTNGTSATAAFDNLAPTTSQGDIIYHNGTDNVRLAKGTAFQILRMNSGATAPVYAPPHVTLVFFGSINTWTDMPAAKTEIYGATLRHEADLTTYSQVRLLAFVGVAGASGSVLYAEYSTNGGSVWATLSDSISMTAASHARTAWATIPAGALADDVVIRVVGESGNAAADPIIGNVEVQLR